MCFYMLGGQNKWNPEKYNVPMSEKKNNKILKLQIKKIQFALGNTYKEWPISRLLFP